MDPANATEPSTIAGGTQRQRRAAAIPAAIEPDVKTTRKQSGRPSKRTVDREERVLKAIRMGAPFDTAARVGGISPATFYAWRRDDAHFAELCEGARAEFEFQMLLQIQEAIKIPANWRAAAYMLERLFPERYALNRLEVTGPNGGPIEHRSGLEATLEMLTVDELRRLARGGRHETTTADEALPE